MFLLIVVIFILETLRNIGLLFQKVTETSELWTCFENLLEDQSMKYVFKCIRINSKIFNVSECVQNLREEEEESAE